MSVILRGDFMCLFNFGWTNSVWNFVVSLGIILVIFGVLTYIYSRVVKRKIAFILLTFSFAVIILSLIFDALPALIVGSSLTAISVSVTFFANLGDLRTFLASPFKSSTTKKGKFGVEKIFNREEFYKEIEKAVLQLSKTRTGAIMTFEKNISLKDIMKNGVAVQAPVTSELLLTIFYPGTRLHDGAVVIHGNEIIAASVFFTATTKPFAVKYGSRHRAAIGVSEVSDSVTIVVSEETGRISVAVNGVITSISPDNFLTAFETFMSDKEIEG